jgi:hypothetical protein
MKMNNLISATLLMILSAPAYSHKIYYDSCDDSEEASKLALDSLDSEASEFDMNRIPGEPSGIGGLSGRVVSGEPEKCYSDSPEAKALRSLNPGAPESDRVAAMAFCKFGGYENTVDCASDVLNKGLVEESKACVQKLWNAINNSKINPVAHKLGGANTATEGVWHFDYRTSKEDGSHRHAYTNAMRETAARTYAAAQIQIEKSRRETESKTSSNTTISGASGGVSADVTVGVPVGGPSVTIGGQAGINGGSEKGTSTQKGPLSQAELDVLWKKFYDMAYSNPQIAGFGPDALCMRNERNCLTSGGQTFKNDSYQPDAPTKKEDASSNKSDSSSSSGNKSSDTHKTPSSSSGSDFGNDGSISTTDGGQWAGEPSKPSDGSMWVDFGQEDPGNDPMGQCIFDAHKEKVKEGSNKTYDTDGSPDRRSDAEKKRDAEALLKKGICDESYYGRMYCMDWKKKKQLIDAAPGDSDYSRPIVAPGEKIERPGYLHFDPNRAPVEIPEHLQDKPGGSSSTPKLPHLKD